MRFNLRKTFPFLTTKARLFSLVHVIISVTKLVLMYPFPSFFLTNLDSLMLHHEVTLKRKRTIYLLHLLVDTNCFNLFLESILARCCWRALVVHQWFNKCQGNHILVVCFIFHFFLSVFYVLMGLDGRYQFLLVTSCFRNFTMWLALQSDWYIILPILL